MALVRTDYGLIYNTDGSLCATLLPEGGVAVTEGTTNLIPSQSASVEEDAPTGWVNVDGTVHERTTDDAWHGQASIRATNTKESGNSWLTRSVGISSPPVGTLYTASAYVRGVPGTSASIGIGFGGGSAPTSWQYAPSTTMNGQWQRVTITHAVDQPDRTHATVSLSIHTAGATYYWDAIQLEAKPFATPFVDGTRPAGRLLYDIPQLKGARDFTLHFKFLPYMFKETAWRQYLFSTRTDNYLHYYASINDSGTRFSINTALEEDDTYVYAHIYNPPININSWHRFVMTGRQEGEQATLSIYLDGVEVYTSTRVGTLRPFPGILALGTNHSYSVSSVFNGAFRELYICPYAVSAETVATWHSLDAPFFDPREQIDAGARPIYAPGVQIDSTGAWGISNGVKQAGFGTDGKLVAGGGSVVADANGLIGKDPDTGEVKFKIGTNGKVEVLEIYSDMYKEIRNVLPYTGQDSLDADKPIVIPFYIPSETTKIVAAFLSAEARRYRAYAKSAPYDPDAFWLKQTKGISFNSPAVSVVLNKSNAATGSTSLAHYHQYSDTHIVSSASGGHSHPLNTAAWPKLYTDYTNPGDGHNHLHTLDSLVIPSNSGTHTHSTTSTTKNTGESQRSGILGPNDLSHSHTYERVVGAQLNNFNNHFHDFDPAHDHKLEFGIHEDTTPANVKIRINNGSGWSGYISLAPAPSDNAAYDLIAGASVPKHNNNASEMDLTPYLSGTGWKYIEFSSSRLGLIAWNIILKLDITA